jgi:MoxR-like ATPase
MGAKTDRPAPSSVEDERKRLAEAGYLADESAALVSFLAERLDKPVLVEGPAGVGKTELAKAVARATGRPLVRPKTRSSERASCSSARS